MRLFQKYFLRTAVMLCIIVDSMATIKAQDMVEIDSVIWSNRSGLENVLQGNSAGLQVESWTGTPGAQSIMNLRSLSLNPSDVSSRPLIMINGVPLIADPSKVTAINPLSYYSPAQIEKVEIIKNIDQLAAYGVQAPNGAINIITKEGKTGPLHVKASASAGYNFIGNYNTDHDAYYHFNPYASDQIYTGSSIHEEDLIIDGGGNYGSYLFGVNNQSDKGIIEDLTFNRQSIFFNAKYNITDKFSTRFYNNLSLAQREGRFAGDLDRVMLIPRVEDEKFFMDKNRNTALISSMGLYYAITPAFEVSSTVGISYEASRRDLYIPSNLLQNNIYALSASFKRQLISVNTKIKYNKQLADEIKMSLTIGNEIVRRENRITEVSGSRTIDADGSNYVKVVTGYSAAQTNAYSDYENDNLASFYGIGRFNIKNDLDLNLTLRADGSSLYKNKWEFHPALGLNYNLKNTTDLPIAVNISAGTTGMLSRPENYRGQLVAIGEYYEGNELGIDEQVKPFDHAQSTSIIQFDAGATLFISNSLSLNAQYFSKTYKDFTYMRYLPNINGLDYELETGMELNLSGIEATLKGTIVRNKNFSWITNLNIAYQANEIKKLPNDIENTNLSHYKALRTGDAFTSVSAFQGGNETVIGNTSPELFGGLNNIFTLWNFSLGAKFTYASGVDIICESFDSRYSENMIGNEFPVKQAETPYYFIKTEENGDAIYQGIKSIEDGSFLRLSTATISYDFKTLAQNSMTISNMQLYARADNLFTLTKFSGSNPEENTNGIRKYDMSTTGTPLPLSLVIGLKLQF